MHGIYESTDIEKSFLIHKLHCSKYLLRNVSLIIHLALFKNRPSLVAQMVNNPPAIRETWVQSLNWKDPVGEGNGYQPNILACRIPWTEEPGWLQFKGWKRVGHD